MELFQQLAEILKVSGGWGLSALLMVVIYKLNNKRDEDRKEFDEAKTKMAKDFGELLEKRHNEYTNTLKETTDVLTAIIEVVRKCGGPNAD